MPLVVCRRGLIYNKESLIKKMLDKTMPFEFRHIRKLSNLVTVSAASFDQETKQVCCSVSRELFSDLKPFKIYHCGCVVSEAALSELQTKEDIEIDSCVVCGQKIENEPIALNQSNHEQEWFMKKFDQEEKQSKSKKRLRSEVAGEQEVQSHELKRQRVDAKSTVFQSIFQSEDAEAREFEGDFMTRCAKMGLR